MQTINEILNVDPGANGAYRNLRIQVDKIRRHARQGSYGTRERYYYAMILFIKFLAAVFRLEKLENLCGKHVCGYIEYRQAEGIAPATIKNELCAIRYYHDQMANAKYRLPSNDELSVNLEKRRFGEVDRTWTEPEYKAMVKKAEEIGKPVFADVLLLAHDMGLRLHEAYRIDTAMARNAIKSGTLQIKGKGGKVRLVPLPESCRTMFSERLKITPQGEKLFVPNDVQTHNAMLEMELFLLKYRDSVRDPSNPVLLTYHGLRHTYAATTYLRLKSEGRSDFEAHIAVSRLLGHDRADVTDIYLAAVKDGWDHM